MAVGKTSLFSRVIGTAGKIGDPKEHGLWTKEDRKIINAAVAAAERSCGIQIMVFVGRTKDDPHGQAIEMLQAHNFKTTPGVLFLVDPDKHIVEVVTSEHALERVSNADADHVVEAMVPYFRDHKFAQGLAHGIAMTAEIAGPGEETGEELPDMLN